MSIKFEVAQPSASEHAVRLCHYIIMIIRVIMVAIIILR